ncbi:GNAT family N-acetyltransferase [Nocardioides sp. GBK3QG-3]|uniref:GNAT family N-acetyltransferase n=1 Tax=Nocardioides mangrovi TaxID=2874580 RepID=A0ABS7UBN3_9ACTN|nr:GNAT family protein [Nocardioides mangrovi]MBZ5738141.1 GNAT family N-acetyltransferase [Nocardioides mangrovi]
MTQDLSAVAWPVRTDRLTLRPATLDDVAALWRIRRIPSVHEWLGHDFSDEARFAEMMADPDRLTTTLVIELDGAVVGDLYLRVTDAWAQSDVAEQARNTVAEIGWVLDPAHEGRGLATEAARELLRISFEDLGVRRVKALCFADNEPSWRLMERLGMRREEHARADSLHRTKGWLDGFTYALLVSEWSPGPSSAGA